MKVFICAYLSVVFLDLVLSLSRWLEYSTNTEVNTTMNTETIVRNMTVLQIPVSEEQSARNCRKVIKDIPAIRAGRWDNARLFTDFGLNINVSGLLQVSKDFSIVTANKAINAF